MTTSRGRRGISLNRRAALVTGASCGIGAATAVELARRGATVALLSRRAAPLATTAARCEAAGGHAVAVVCDLASDDGAEAAAAEARGEIGPIDVLVNCAGLHCFKPALHTSMVEVEEMFDVNFFGAVALTLEVLPEMVARRTGTVVNVTSVTAQLPDPGEAAYGASKAALSLWSHAMALDLHKTGVTIGVVSPGPTATETAPGERYYRGRRYPASGVAAGIVRMVERGGVHRTTPRRFGVITAIYPSCGAPLRALIGRARPPAAAASR